MKYQAFMHHFFSVGGWLEGSWGGWWCCGGVGGGGVLVDGGVGGVLVRGLAGGGVGGRVGGVLVMGEGGLILFLHKKPTKCCRSFVNFPLNSCTNLWQNFNDIYNVFYR